jgi:hypothetical protein
VLREKQIHLLSQGLTDITRWITQTVFRGAHPCGHMAAAEPNRRPFTPFPWESRKETPIHAARCLNFRVNERPPRVRQAVTGAHL